MPREDLYRTRSESPSFSSSLLDAIYRSIDDKSNGSHHDDEELSFGRDKSTMMRKKKQSSSSLKQELNNSARRACMIQKWMQQKKEVSSEIKAFGIDPMLLNSSSTSPDSSCGGVFSSSESDSFHSAKSRSNSSHCHRSERRTVRTIIFQEPKHGVHEEQKAPKHHEGGGFIRTKSKAMKIYSDLKKVKQPISPGGKLASFITSLFTSASPKNPMKSTSEQLTSTYSPASSFSRSCLSRTKTPSSKGNVGIRTKRSVRFCLDEDSTPRGELKIRHENELQAPMRISVMNKEIEPRTIEENRRVAEAARELLNRYRKQKKEEFDTRANDDDDEDDAASYASSDLFELENLSDKRYLEELPVYETTHFDANRAIAKGLIL
ncbi:hypothetical protein V6N13_023728 [Hibiscus sabdariffa]|uniref:Protein BIG GRAIN 1-like A n=1 Tax=Hibiscus sabdariffa TaxID=183260 RepID=A0ABR2PML6_9ROSI